MKQRIFVCILSVLLILSLLPVGVIAEETETVWWTQEYWPREVLTDLGAILPDYNRETGQYEISSPEQLLFLSGIWKPEDSNADGQADAPCNGTYVLTRDIDMAPLLDRIGTVLSEKKGSETKGYMPPIAACVDETEEGGIACAFFGTFDGQGHVIRNLRIERIGSKYVGLFGNIGHDFGTGSVKNLAILDAEIVGTASCGILAGSVYGDVDNVVCTGSIDCFEKNAGGLAGKIKRNENGYRGVARNCFVYCDIVIRGEGAETGPAGGISASNSKGGQVMNCFIGGSIRVLGTNADSIAGVVGNLKGGSAIDNNVVLLSEINGGKESSNVGPICGNFSGDTGSHLHNNYVWEGTRLYGGLSSDHPDIPVFAEVTASELRSRSLYEEKLGWDFDSVWDWVGEPDFGYPMLKPYAEAIDMNPRMTADLTIHSPVLRLSEPLINAAYEGEPAVVDASVLLPENMTVDGGTLYYGASKKKESLTSSVPMTVSDHGLTASFLPDPSASSYYYCRIQINGETYDLPSEGTLRLDIVSSASLYAPQQITLSPGSVPEEVCFNWITESDGLTAELRYRHAGSPQWENVIPVTEIERVQVRDDHGTFTSYSADVTGLDPDTAYEYAVVTNDGTRDYVSSVYSFTTLPSGKSFSFAVISDLQGISEEAYLPFQYTMDSFLKENLHPDFIVNAGDLTEDDTMAEWRFMYDTIGGIYATKLTAFAPGNHENKGDVIYSHFKGRTNLPKGIDDEMLAETTSSFVVGDVCFVTLNTDPYTGIENADASADKLRYYQMQKEWAKEVFEQSGCTFRVIIGHAGLVQKDPAATAFLEQMCDELDVDLFFNGHIHNYFRATVDGNGLKQETGNATTFVTVSPMGTKFDDYGHEIDDLLAFQTGGSYDPRQYFAYVEAEDGALTVSVYQRTASGDATKKNCADYTLIDSFRLEKETEAILESPEAAEPSSAPSPETFAEEPDPVFAPGMPNEQTRSPIRSALLWTGICILAVAGLVVAVILLRKDK